MNSCLVRLLSVLFKPHEEGFKEDTVNCEDDDGKHSGQFFKNLTKYDADLHQF